MIDWLVEKAQKRIAFDITIAELLGMALISLLLLWIESPALSALFYTTAVCYYIIHIIFWRVNHGHRKDSGKH